MSYDHIPGSHADKMEKSERAEHKKSAENMLSKYAKSTIKTGESKSKAIHAKMGEKKSK